ncbi:hypothetical protein T02_15920 [Trichinella nativa]|uniref:Uncharacterized protein n=1 Tax=Trichinella nativa TaxID=6335 RepID=A0A0V1LI66_9BILA|nr:hypothetical protein T02_15920 [Trichinella nativa]
MKKKDQPVSEAKGKVDSAAAVRPPSKRSLLPTTLLLFNNRAGWQTGSYRCLGRNLIERGIWRRNATLRPACKCNVEPLMRTFGSQTENGIPRELVKIGQEVARQLEVDNAIEQVNCVHQKRLIEKPNAGPSRGVIVNTTVSGQARTTSNTCSASHLSYNTGVGQLHRHRPIDGLSRNLCTKKENNFDLLCNANPHRVMGNTIGFAGSSPKPSSPYGDYNYKKKSNDNNDKRFR